MEIFQKILNFIVTPDKITLIDVFIRLVLATLIGGIIGSERGKHGSAAGLRTHILVCLGSAMTSLTGIYLNLVFGMGNDVTRIAALVISGIGFIGAGTIIVTKRRQVKGLTTAAGLWTSAIIGLAIGVGYYEVALYATFLILVTEPVLARLDWFLHSKAKNINVCIEYTNAENLTDIMSEIKQREIEVIDIEIAKARSETDHHISAVLSLQLSKKASQNVILTAISNVNGVQTVEEL